MHYQFDLLLTVITIGVVMGAVLGTCAYLILLERKIAAYVQDRLGPNRVGPWGLLQPIADGLKFLFKEEVIPRHVDRLFYLVAPAIATTRTVAPPLSPRAPPPLLTTAPRITTPPRPRRPPRTRTRQEASRAGRPGP